MATTFVFSLTLFLSLILSSIPLILRNLPNTSTSPLRSSLRVVINIASRVYIQHSDTHRLIPNRSQSVSYDKKNTPRPPVRAQRALSLFKFPMRFSPIISVLSTPLLLLNLAGNAIASPLIIAERGTCANPCGWGNEYCCSANEACTTSNGQALCVNGGGGGGGWQYYTTTWTATETETTTVVSVWSSSAPATTPAPTGTGTCKYDLGESVCGTICCDATQDCVDGQCVEGSSSAAATGEPTPGIRPTSNGASTATQTSAPTTTEGFIAPVGTDGADLIGAKATSSHSGLSGGAIAGIVIGVIAGVILLFLLCACLCFKEALDGILAALGFGKRRRRKETTTYEHYSHHSGGSRPRPQGRTWFGTRPNDSEISEKKSSGKRWAYIAVVLGALALCLGLKRRREEHDDGSTDYTYPSSYYYYSDYGSESSGGRTRDTRRSRRSRTRSGR